MKCQFFTSLVTCYLVSSNTSVRTEGEKQQNSLYKDCFLSAGIALFSHIRAKYLSLNSDTKGRHKIDKARPDSVDTWNRLLTRDRATLSV